MTTRGVQDWQCSRCQVWHRGYPRRQPPLWWTLAKLAFWTVMIALCLLLPSWARNAAPWMLVVFGANWGFALEDFGRYKRCCA